MELRAGRVARSGGSTVKMFAGMIKHQAPPKGRQPIPAKSQFPQEMPEKGQSQEGGGK